MKSTLSNFLHSLLITIGLLTPLCIAQDKPTCSVSIAALNLPAGSTGQIHIRDTETSTKPLQLSTRYFSERIELKRNLIQIYKDALIENSPDAVPLLTLEIPAETREAYVALWIETDDKNQSIWKGQVFDSKDWIPNSLKVVNFTTDQLGISADSKEILLEPGKSADFPSSEWPKSFTAKIYQTKPEKKNLLSSTWQVSTSNRELCFIYNIKNRVSLRSIMDIATTPKISPP